MEGVQFGVVCLAAVLTLSVSAPAQAPAAPAPSTPGATAPQTSGPQTSGAPSSSAPASPQQATPLPSSSAPQQAPRTASPAPVQSSPGLAAPTQASPSYSAPGASSVSPATPAAPSPSAPAEPSAAPAAQQPQTPVAPPATPEPAAQPGITPQRAPSPVNSPATSVPGSTVRPSQAPATSGQQNQPSATAPNPAATPAGIPPSIPSAPAVQTMQTPASPTPFATTPSGADTYLVGPNTPASALVIGQPGAPPAPAPSVETVSLQEAIRRAQTVDHNYVSAVVDKGTADAQKAIARSAVLPNVDYHNQAIYTQPQRPYTVAGTNGVSGPAPIFIANNSVREYISQGIASETIGYGRIADLRKADAEAAAARARLEVARRGLVATVVGSYYGLLSAEAKERITAFALDEANTFVRVSTQLEAGGEVSHNDVLKAQLTQEQRLRDHDDAILGAVKARLDLGVLLFPDPRTPFALNVDLRQPPALATRAELEANAKTGNVDVRAALASLRAADAGIASAIGGYFPDLALSYNYGIDSDHFAIHDANGIRNLGYSAAATLDIPVWDWFATRARVRQSQLARTLAQADLTLAQRRALAAFQQFYGEADLASRQIASLDRSVADAAEALRLTDLRYAAGEGTALEVVDAQSTLVSAETARVDGTIRYFTALANLQTMTGNLP